VQQLEASLTGADGRCRELEESRAALGALCAQLEAAAQTSPKVLKRGGGIFYGTTSSLCPWVRRGNVKPSKLGGGQTLRGFPTTALRQSSCPLRRWRRPTAVTSAATAIPCWRCSTVSPDEKNLAPFVLHLIHSALHSHSIPKIIPFSIAGLIVPSSPQGLRPRSNVHPGTSAESRPETPLNRMLLARPLPGPGGGR